MRVRLSLLIIFTIISLLACPQSADEIKRFNTDSLSQVLAELSGAEKIDTLNKIAAKIYIEHPDSCLKLATWTVHLSDSLDYKKGLADGYFNIGNSYLMQDSLFPTVVNYLKAMRIYEEMGPSVKYANVCAQMAMLNGYTLRFKSAIHYFLKEISILKELKRIDINGSYHMIAYLKFRLGEYDSALYYNELAASLTDSTKFYFICNNYGIIWGINF